VPIDLAIVAEDVKSYKPAHAHWERFFEATTADREHHVHVAASLFHDIAPARELELRSVWINRLGEQAEPEPDRELSDLSSLPDTLDELVPA
jgi:2-haloacid dehalogenase